MAAEKAHCSAISCAETFPNLVHTTPCLKKLPITRRTLTPHRCSRERIYLAAHVLLLSRVAAVMLVGLVMDGGQSEEARDR